MKKITDPSPHTHTHQKKKFIDPTTTTKKIYIRLTKM